MSHAVGLPSPPPPPLHLNGNSSSTASDCVDMAKTSVAGYKWRLVIAYDGTHYAGWQYQQSPPTIQCIMEKALTRITKVEREDLLLVGASRTDAGVHAWGQVRHSCANEV